MKDVTLDGNGVKISEEMSDRKYEKHAVKSEDKRERQKERKGCTQTVKKRGERRRAQMTFQGAEDDEKRARIFRAYNFTT